MAEYKLGDEVEDKVTGLRGIVIGRTVWRYTDPTIIVQPPVIDVRTGGIAKPVVFHESQLRVVSDKS